MTQVIPLSGKPERSAQEELNVLRGKAPDGSCAHLAYEVMGVTHNHGEANSSAWEKRKCADCGHRWTVSIDEPTTEEHDAAKEKPGKPPKAVYGHAQVVTYQTSEGQYDLVIGELATVSVQNGLLVVGHHDAPVLGIVGVRPWVEEDRSGTDAED